MKKWIFTVALLAICSIAQASEREFAIDLWDWTVPCRDLGKFKAWCIDFKSIGGNRIEISAPWNLLEPLEGKYDLSYIRDRLQIARSAGLGLRIRINSFYQGATPPWLIADHWKDAKGDPPTATPNPVSICDERFLARFEKLCTTLARNFRGEDIYFSPFIGVHAELKWSDWWTYDDSSLEKWTAAIRHPRPQWLNDVVGDAELPSTINVPRGTFSTPDLSADSRAFIAFREHAWRDVLDRFNKAFHDTDPQARTSAPLGESYRSQSAQMSNLDYVGLSRGFDQVVHSYDFFWHPSDDPWWAGASVACFSGMTGKEVVFEFDGPVLNHNLGYTHEQLLKIADAVLAQGAGVKAANYSYYDQLPSTHALLRDLAIKLRNAKTAANRASAPSQTILLFVSKWANYCYRENTEWLHEAQFGAWKMLTDHGLPVRFICEDNLAEDLTKYRGLYVAYSPLAIMSTSAQAKLQALQQHLPTIVEVESIPPRKPSRKFSTDLKLTSAQSKVLIGHPLAFLWLHSDRARAEQVLTDAIKLSWQTNP